MSDTEAPPDGDYDVFVLDVVDEPADDAAGAAAVAGAGPAMRLDLTIVAGELKGQVISVSSPVSLGSFVDLVGMPATLTVRDGVPTVSIDS